MKKNEKMKQSYQQTTIIEILSEEVGPYHPNNLSMTGIYIKTYDVLILKICIVYVIKGNSSINSGLFVIWNGSLNCFILYFLKKMFFQNGY